MCSCVHSEFYNNYDGLLVFQLNEEDNKVVIKDMTAKNNQESGMYLTGTGITVENANIKNTIGSGLLIGGNVENEITLAGDVTITNSKYGFDTTTSAEGKVYVTGNLVSNRNDEFGLGTFSTDLTIAVGGSYSGSGKSGKSGSGSITACENTLDIYNFGGANFEGTDYTCGTTDGTDLPVCKPCFPGCPSPEPDADESSSHIMSAAFEIKELDFADHMDHEEFPL